MKRKIKRREEKNLQKEERGNTMKKELDDESEGEKERIEANEGKGEQNREEKH